MDDLDRLDKAALFFYASGGSLFTIMCIAWVAWFLGYTPSA